MDPTLGYVTLFGASFAPRSWALCEGQILPINQNQSLYSLLGTQYGGDGRTSFGLPDLRGRAVVGAPGGNGLGNKGGLQNVTLAPSELPAHTHDAPEPASLPADAVSAPDSAPSGSNAPARGFLAGLGQDLNLYRPPTTPTSLAGATANVGNAGNSGGHVNEQPYLALHYIIALQGLFPSRN